MRKSLRTIFSLLLCLLLVLSLPLSALAEEVPESEERTVLHIFRKKQFLDFADSCRLDSYSRNLDVILMRDIDLSGEDFSGIPIFCGSFDGNGHAVTGLSITTGGSNMGLFRYVDASAVIENLSVSGEVAPDGSRCTVGGIAGNNAGIIRNCSFSGTVSGSNDVGGLVGINAVSGTIEDSRCSGVISGDHRVGGIAGNNPGVIRGCSNRAEVNTTAEENQVALSDITLNTVIGTESAGTVTDIGGIAGSSSGVIRECKNRGSVGYQHMGYNVGGIVGTQTGYVYKCHNFARVYGRKEVGGIVGQMEPTTTIEYTKDTLQILQAQLGTLSQLTNQAFSSIQDGTSDAYSQMGNIYGSVEDAKDAVDSLLPNPDDPSLPDQDTIDAAKNALSNSLTDIKTSVGGIADSTGDSLNSLSGTLRSISGQVNAMSTTIGNASQNMGSTIADISDLDMDEILTGKVKGCSNSGDVLADLNAGGIVGAIALENDLDPEDDLQIVGNSSLNFSAQLRAVVLSSRNTGSVTVKRQNAGGIVGWMSLGLTKGCLSTGSIDAEDADYVGGVVGQSSGYIRQCSAKSAIVGNAYVGGIVGKGDTVTDCRSMVRLAGTEKSGAVLGLREKTAGFLNVDMDGTQDEQTSSVTGNFYLPVDEDIGGIDGVSYEGSAQPLTREDFSQLEGIDPVFLTVSVCFVFEDGATNTVTLSPGESLSADSIPKLPEKDGYVACWEGLKEADLTNIRFDMTFHAAYTADRQTVQSEAADENGLPRLLAQGLFSGDTPIELTALEKGPAPGENEKFLEGYSFTLPAGTANTLRYLPGAQSKTLRVMVQSADGSWREVSHTQDGSYLVFAIEDGDQGFCLIETPEEVLWQPAAIAGGAAVVVLFAVILLIRHRKKRAAKAAVSGEKN